MQGSKYADDLKVTQINWAEISPKTKRGFIAISKAERISPKQMILKLVEQCVDARATGAKAKGAK